MEDKWNNSTSL